MKLTGERPIEGKTPDSLMALHAAGYREVRARLGQGSLLDLGCGLGDGTKSLVVAADAQPHSAVVGVDYDPTTAREAYDLQREAHLMTVCSDGSALALAGQQFDNVCSSHLIEHFTEPQFHVKEVARVLDPEGSAFFLTPNAPADFENPYHVYLFDPDDLRNMLSEYFDDVQVLGLDATENVKADFARRRALAHKLLRLDPLGLRHKLPRSWFVALHAAGRRVAYRALASKQVDGNSGITDAEFFITDAIDDTTLVLLAIARKPKR